MLFWLIPFIIGMILLAVFLFFRVKEERVKAVIIKGFVSLMFIITALVAYLTSNNPTSSFGIFILIGLFFGLLGDVFLDLKFIVLKKETLYTILGFISFAINHLFNILGLFLNFYNKDSNIAYLLIPIGIALLLVVVTLLMEKFSPIRYKNMKPFVIFYGLFLFFVTPMYWSTAIQSGFQNITVIIISISLIFFMLSDLILNNTYFATGFNTPAFIISNHVLYYIAQFGIAISLFFLV